jgi:hypothetical protein
MSKALLRPEAHGEIALHPTRGEIGSLSSPLSLVHALVPMACGLKLVPALV